MVQCVSLIASCQPESPLGNLVRFFYRLICYANLKILTGKREMALVKEDIDLIREMIAKAFAEKPETNQSNVRYELELRERIVRVEEELKHQRELMLEGFKQMEKRFEQVDKRFEQIDKRFEQVDKRFEVMTARIDRFMVWSFATTLTVGGIVIAVIKYLP
jgi:predicted nuclease with TOPRIM domain